LEENTSRIEKLY